jgi:hypothetical protein
MRPQSSAIALVAAGLAVARVVAQIDLAPVEIRVPVAPIVVAGADGHLAYELHVTNFYSNTGTLRLERVDVFTDTGTTPVVRYSAAALDGRVMHPGAEPGQRYGRAIEGGRRVIVHIWLTVSPREAAALRVLKHRLVFLDDKGAEQAVDGAPIAIETAVPIVLGPPIRGGRWLVHNGPGNHRSPHWGSLLARNGRVTIPQRFAVDWIGVDETGRAVRGDFQKSNNEDWVGFGAEVIAVADGVVRDMRDGVVDHAPLVEPPPPASVTLEAVGGNYVLLELSPNTFVYYAHLKQDSVVVKPGQRVVRGQMLGRLGNSGNTNAPHLHFHVGDTGLFNDSEGLPFVLDSFELLGEMTAERAIGAEAAQVTPTVAQQSRRRELPLQGMVVRFP